MTMSSSSSSRCRRRQNSESGEPPSKRQEIITKEEIVEYIVNKAQRKAVKAAKKLKSSEVISRYSGDDDSEHPFFGDSLFVWRKKIERDVTQHGLVDDEYFSVRAKKKRQRERMAEIEKVKKRKEERAIQKAQRDEEMALLARQRARAEFDEWEKKERQFDFDQCKIRSELAQARINEQESSDQRDHVEDEEEDGLVCPKYISRVHTGYEWNKYTRTHYDHDNPPLKTVHGYKFNIFYPDLVDQSKPPIYSVEKDGDGAETCIITFHAAQPYDDIAFRIVNGEWDYSCKNGFRCTFDNGILRLYFNFKRFRYHR